MARRSQPFMAVLLATVLVGLVAAPAGAAKPVSAAKAPTFDVGLNVDEIPGNMDKTYLVPVSCACGST